MSDAFTYDVFLSHSAKDKSVVRPLAERLRKDGLRVWFDEWVLKPGDPIQKKIDDGLEESRVLVLCMSANAFGSDWAQLEAGTFRFRDPLNKERRFIPLRLDDAPIKGSLAQFLYINWLPVDREQEYARLLESCRHLEAWPLRRNEVSTRDSQSHLHAPDFPSPHDLATKVTSDLHNRLDDEWIRGILKGSIRSTRALFTLPGTHRKNPYFTPKHEVVDALSSLRAGDTLVLCGPPGVGKTQHAVQHAQEERQQYSMVLWASAESVQGLRQALAALADILLPITETSLSTEAKVVALREWLATEPSWLLILDNADMVDAAREIERFIPSAHHGYVLVTSQIADWTSAFRMERVEVWTVDQSSEFLAQRLPRCEADKVNLARLCSELGGLPLALEHAAAYIVETGIPAGEYLDLLRRDRRTVLGRRYPGMTDYRASITATWQLSVRRLGWLARQILHYAACLASEPIPRSILPHLLSSASVDRTYSPFERSQLRRAMRPPDALNLSLAELGRYSLVSLSEDSVRLHPLLQQVVLDSARLRPWQARSWLYRMWQRAQSGPLGAGLWLYRTGHLLNLKGVLPADIGNDAATLEMRPFIAHLHALSRNIAVHAPGLSVLRDGAWIGGSMPLERTLEWFEEKIDGYESGMSVLRGMIESTAHESPDLTAETEWFLAHVEGLYKQVVERSLGKNLSHNLRRLSREGVENARRDLYSFLDTLAREQAAIGAIDTARRLFRFYLAQAAADPEAPKGEVARARLYEALSLQAHLPRDELQSLLEATLVLYEGDDERINPDVCKAVLIYAIIATTPESQSRALGWIRRALPNARGWLAGGWDHACALTEEYVRILGDDDKSDESLLACEETLRLALKSRKLARKSVTVLWQQRGHLLRSRQRFLASARSYARCLALELKHDKPAPFRQIDLHLVTGEMYLKAEAILAARMHLLKAHDLLEIHWSDDPLKAEAYAVAVGVALGQAHEEAKGEAMLRRALARP
jgi:hypothetical protein